MFKNILKQISYREILSVLLVIVGICFAVMSEEITIKVIAICISFFGVVALTNIIAQKITYSVQHNRFKIKPTTHLKTTVISDTQAKRTTIDNFEVTAEDKEAAVLDFLGADEGFIIVNKSTSTSASASATDNLIVNKSTSASDNVAADINNNSSSNAKAEETKTPKSYTIDFELEGDARSLATSKLFSLAETDEELVVQTIKTELDFHNTQENQIVRDIKRDIKNISTSPANIASESVAEGSASDANIVFDATVTELDKDGDIDKNKDKSKNSNYNSNYDKNNYDKNNYDNSNYNKNIADSDYDTTISSKSVSAKKIDISRLVVAEENSEFKNPIDEFGYLISRFLVIIRSVVEANTVAFVWVNYEKRRLLFDAYMSTQKVQSAVKQNTQIPLGSDILSQIASSAKPEILTEINPISELDLIPYYEASVGTSSFIGIPIIFEKIVVGILCADTDKKDAYDKSTAVFLGQFTRLLSTLFGSYSQKFTFVNAAKTLDVMNKLTNMITEKGCTFTHICSAVTEFMSHLSDCTSVGICTYNEQSKFWQVSSYKSIESVAEEFFTTSIGLDSSLVGMSISECRKISVAQLSDEYTRVNDFEPAIDNGSFVAVPVKSITDTYGALFMEARASSALTTIEIDVIEAVCNLAGELYEKLNLIALFNNNVTIDKNTGILNSKALRIRITEELARSRDTNSTISLVLIALDKYSSFDDKNKKNKIINYIISECRNYLKSYDVIGRVNEDTIGIVNINQDAHQAKLYVERIRHQIATKFVEINSVKVVLTISAGIVAAISSDTFATFTTNATVALQNAQKRGNSIQIFQ